MLGDWEEPEVGDPEYDDNGDRATDDNMLMIMMSVKEVVLQKGVKRRVIK